MKQYKVVVYKNHPNELGDFLNAITETGWELNSIQTKEDPGYPYPIQTCIFEKEKFDNDYS